jgi:membrane-associated HD superfamily phosphohydrolase
MVFDPRQFKQKKKRVVNPDIPRPNLFSHEKKLKESQMIIDDLQAALRKQLEEINQLKSNYSNMHQSINQIINYLRKDR